MENWEKIARELIGITISKKQSELFHRYEEELLEWNSHTNLTAVRDANGVHLKHFVDSLTCISALGNLNQKSLIDIGTGAGFPGIPLKIIYPEMHLVLVDSVGKKTAFCQHIINILQLKDCEVMTARSEELGLAKQTREKFDVAVARAVAAMPVLCEYLLPLVKVGGMMLAQKGSSAEEDLHNADRAIEVLGGGDVKSMPIQIPGLDDTRYLISIHKLRPTPPGYPRRTGLPSKKPIL